MKLLTTGTDSSSNGGVVFNNKTPRTAAQFFCMAIPAVKVLFGHNAALGPPPVAGGRM